MGDKRITELASGSPAQAGDLFVAERGGINVCLSLADIQATGGAALSAHIAAADPHTSVMLANGTRHDLTARHTLGTVVPHDVHSALSGLSADDHVQYLLANGTRPLTGPLAMQSVVPLLTDAYDLGTALKLWRRIYASELDAVIFAKTTASLIGGLFMIPKNTGTIPVAAAAGAGTVDFGQAMTADDFVVFRSFGVVEYMKVGVIATGTEYNVTRNLDGSGANDWPAGTVYAVLGQSANGNGRIEMDATVSPRFSIITQSGANYYDQTEVVRIGNLNGAFGVVADHYGFVTGDYAAGNYLLYTPTDGLILKAGAGAVKLDITGISITTGASLQSVNTLTFKTTANDLMYLYGYSTAATGPGTYVGEIVVASTITGNSVQGQFGILVDGSTAGGLLDANYIMIRSGTISDVVLAVVRQGVAKSLTLTSAALTVDVPIKPGQYTSPGGVPAYVKGAVYFDVTTNKLIVGGATAWETITSA